MRELRSLILISQNAVFGDIPFGEDYRTLYKLVHLNKTRKHYAKEIKSCEKDPGNESLIATHYSIIDLIAFEIRHYEKHFINAYELLIAGSADVSAWPKAIFNFLNESGTPVDADYFIAQLLKIGRAALPKDKKAVPVLDPDTTLSDEELIHFVKIHEDCEKNNLSTLPDFFSFQTKLLFFWLGFFNRVKGAYAEMAADVDNIIRAEAMVMTDASNLIGLLHTLIKDFLQDARQLHYCAENPDLLNKMLPQMILQIALKETQTRKYTASELNGLREKLGLLSKRPESPFFDKVSISTESEADESEPYHEDPKAKTLAFPIKETFFGKRRVQAMRAKEEDVAMIVEELDTIETTPTPKSMRARRLSDALLIAGILAAPLH